MAAQQRESMDRTHIPTSFKRLTASNWTEPDEASSAFAALNLESGAREDIDADGWAERFLSIELSHVVPEDIRDMWAVARGVLLYGWFFYPLYALGEDQLRRVADAAVLIRYEQVGGPNDRRTGRTPNLKRRLAWLIANGFISETVQQRWDAIRNLRNYGSHPSFARIEMPVGALQSLAVLADEINALFDAD